jgi:cytochrome c553
MRKRIKYDDATLQRLANYLSQQPSASPYPWGNPEIIAQGQDIYDNGIESRGIQACGDCHGDQGNGFGRFPRLRSQSLSFFMSQIFNYKSGLIDKQKAMSAIAAQITDDEALAIGSYLESK